METKTPLQPSNESVDEKERNDLLFRLSLKPCHKKEVPSAIQLEQMKRWPVLDVDKLETPKKLADLQIELPDDCLGFLVYDHESGRFKRYVRRRGIKYEFVQAGSPSNASTWLNTANLRVLRVPEPSTNDMHSL
jgi:hypothetical protein